ncbi:MAG: DMT family transporter [Deltaproteobacteria bacterium]|nr:DMT family transporter [Deltaproteobacteria bacterium]
MSESRQPIPAKVHLALLFVQFTFGIFHVVGKGLLGHMHPLALAGIRVTVAAPLLLALAWALSHEKPKRSDLPTLAVLGLFGVFINQVLFITGLSYTTATNAAILMPAIPVFTAAVAATFRVERMTIFKALGVAFAVGGALVMLDVFRFSLARETVFGNILILLNTLSFSCYLVIQRPILKRLSPVTVVAWAYLFGGAGVLAVSAPKMIEFVSSGPELWMYAGLAYVVLIPTTIVYVVNAWAVSRSTATLVATYTTLQPLATASFAGLFLGEAVGRREAAGFVLIVAGLMFVSRSRNKES